MSLWIRWTLCPLTVALVLAALVELLLGKTVKAVTVAAAVTADAASQALTPPPIASTALHLLPALDLTSAVVILAASLIKRSRSF